MESNKISHLDPLLVQPDLRFLLADRVLPPFYLRTQRLHRALGAAQLGVTLVHR